MGGYIYIYIYIYMPHHSLEIDKNNEYCKISREIPQGLSDGTVGDYSFVFSIVGMGLKE